MHNVFKCWKELVRKNKVGNVSLWTEKGETLRIGSTKCPQWKQYVKLEIPVIVLI